MRYLSIDLEATGLKEDCLIIEFAAIPFCTKTQDIDKNLSFHTHIKCPPFEKLKPTLDKWVIDHNRNLIIQANKSGITLKQFHTTFGNYLQSDIIQDYFNKEKIMLFGKSLNAIDLPFMKRDLGWNFFNEHFHHRIQDLSSFALGLIDLGALPEKSDSSSKLMELFNMGEVCHTALEDAIHTAVIYLKLIEKFQTAFSQ